LDEHERELFEAYNAAGEEDSGEDVDLRDISASVNSETDYHSCDGGYHPSPPKPLVSLFETASNDLGASIRSPPQHSQAPLDNDCWEPRFPSGFTIQGGEETEGSQEEEEDLQKFRLRFKQNVIQSKESVILIHTEEETIPAKFSEKSWEAEKNDGVLQGTPASCEMESWRRGCSEQPLQRDPDWEARAGISNQAHANISSEEELTEVKVSEFEEAKEKDEVERVTLSRDQGAESESERGKDAKGSINEALDYESPPARPPTRRTRSRTPREDARDGERRSDPVETPPVSKLRGEKSSSLSSVWKNLQAIFVDIDAGNSAVQSPELEVPLVRLRHLLQLHTQLGYEEQAIRKSQLGLLVEAGWHLEKLRQIEELVSSTCVEENMAMNALGSDASLPSLAARLQSELCREGRGFKLLSSSKG